MFKENTFNWSLAICLTFFVIWFLIVAVIFIVDPLNQYSVPDLTSSKFYREDRYAIPGQAKHAHYDFAIVGSSATLPYSSAAVKEKTGLEAINFSIKGGTAFEQKTLVNTILETHPNTTIMWQQSWLIHRWGLNETRFGSNNFPIGLYKFDLKSKISYLINVKYFLIALDHLFSPDGSSFNTGLGAKSWSGDSEKEDLAHTLLNFDKEAFSKTLLAHPINKKIGYDANEFAEKFEQNIHSVVRKYSNAKFIFVLPPYPTITYEVFNELLPDTTPYMEALTRELALLAKNNKNVMLINFQNDASYLNNFDLYKDFLHFKIDTAKDILDQILEQSKLFLNKENRQK